jgi:hypothetical protein
MATLQHVQDSFRDRIKEFRRIPADKLLYNPKNWRKHPPKQLAALRGILSEIGFAGAELARETEDGIMLIDGAARKQLMGTQPVPVLITDLSEEEADLLLAVFDPLSALAETNQKQLDDLLYEVNIHNEALSRIVSELTDKSEFNTSDEDLMVELKQLDTRPPPALSWVLIGIPTIRYGDIAETIGQIAELADVTCLTTVTDK